MKAVSIVLLAALSCALFNPVAASDAARFKEEVVWSFGTGADGQVPVAGLIHVKDMLYGTTLGGGNGDGTVFAIDLLTGGEKILYSFCHLQSCADGASPKASLIDVKSTLYGTTYAGGISDYGTVFALDLRTDGEKVVYSFCRDNNCTDGAVPEANLINVEGTLYGTTSSGGYYGGGTVFTLDPKTGAEAALYSFCKHSCTDGLAPVAGLTYLNGLLYGTTSEGGVGYMGTCAELGCGVAFSVDPKTGAGAVVYSFLDGPDAQTPLAGLTDVNGILYGTASQGGATPFNNLCQQPSCGALFAIDPRAGTEKVIYSFCSQKNCKDGANPVAGLINVNGILCGTTPYGGITNCNGYGCGTVFSIDPNTGVEKVIYTFCSKKNCTDGAFPQAGLLDVHGTLYGTTYFGGAYGNGTVFALKKTR